MIAAIVSCAICAAASAEYDFVPDPDRIVGYIDDWGLVTGKLTARGEFVAGYKQPWQDSVPPSGARSLDAGGFLDLAPLHPGRPGQNVYRFQDGVLVPGVVGPKGGFVNEPGAAIVPFEGYKRRLFGRPVWNLPGRFELVKLQAAPKPQRPPSTGTPQRRH